MKRFSILVLVCFGSLLAADAWNAEDYVKHSSLQQSCAQMIVSGLQLQGDEHIVDVGCGDGRLVEQLAGMLKDGEVVGIDSSESMVKRAQERILSYNNCSIIHTSVEEADLNRQFDHAIAIHVMHWIPDQPKALQNIYAHVKPGGQFHIVMSPSKVGLPFHTALQKTLASWQEHFIQFVNPQQVYDIETYRQYVVAAGFHIEALHYLYHKTTYANKEAFTGWVRQWLPHAKHLPQHLQEPFLDQFVERYMQEVGVSEGEPIPYGEYVLVLHASKRNQS